MANFNFNFNENTIANIINSVNNLNNGFRLYVDFTEHNETATTDSNEDFTGNIIQQVLGADSASIQLPVNPESLGIEHQANNEVSSVIGLGEINLLHGSKLKEITVESFFPSILNVQLLTNILNKATSLIGNVSPNVSRAANVVSGVSALSNMSSLPPYINTKFLTTTPEVFKQLFVSALEDNTVVKITFTGVNISMLATIEKFKWDIKKGDPDIWYEVTFKEYKSFSFKRNTFDTVNSKENVSVGTTVATRVNEGTTKNLVNKEVVLTNNGSKTLKLASSTTDYTMDSIKNLYSNNNNSFKTIFSSPLDDYISKNDIVRITRNS